MKFTARSYEFCEYVTCNNWIGGAWRPARGGEVLPVENPLGRRDFGVVSPVGRLPLLIEILGRPARSRVASRAGTLRRAR